MNPHVNAIAGRLSLRPPQRRSLEVLHRIMEITPPGKIERLKREDGVRLYEGVKVELYPTLTVKKILRQVLSRCEWGHDDYSLRVENLPSAPLAPGQLDLFGEEGPP